MVLSKEKLDFAKRLQATPAEMRVRLLVLPIPLVCALRPCALRPAPFLP